MIKESDFIESIERNIQNYEEKLADTPKEASVLRNIILEAIKAIHKVKADVLLNRDSDAARTITETEEADKWLENKIGEL